MRDDKKPIGALWEKKSTYGTYFSGQLEMGAPGEKISIVVFNNQHKNSDKHPDWKIFLSRPKTSEIKKTPPPKKWVKPVMEEEDLPF